MSNIKDLPEAEFQPILDERGIRLRQVRKLAGLTRKILKEKYGISANTLQNWEAGKYGGLTVKGAQRMVLAFKQAGIQCTIPWLLHGTGTKPSVIDTVHTQINEPAAEYLVAPKNEESAIFNELLVFRSHYDDTIDLLLPDDTMAPHFLAGDFVAGRRRYGSKIAEVVGRDCIVETTSGEIYLRRVRSGRQENRYTLACSNIHSEISLLMLYDIELYSAAPVIWHRRKDPL